jgi:hypothetical protein
MNEYICVYIYIYIYIYISHTHTHTIYFQKIHLQDSETKSLCPIIQTQHGNSVSVTFDFASRADLHAVFLKKHVSSSTFTWNALVKRKTHWRSCVECWCAVQCSSRRNMRPSFNCKKAFLWFNKHSRNHEYVAVSFKRTIGEYNMSLCIFTIRSLKLIWMTITPPVPTS